MPFLPRPDRVLVRRIEGDAKTSRGLIIPDTAKEKPQDGEIVSAGAGSKDEDGDQYAGIEIVRHSPRKQKSGGPEMSKGDRKRGNREAKKPKKVKEKVVATADFTKGKALSNLDGHKKK